ncbi:YtpR family tRNA-binding protein [Halalkalibacillus halophilus]|uniref:YtpR family tRNA-binding protein n=1 Tax=Halalkalibacillus halophilus TaxID=392827 RepID=UPI000423C875|nr:DUF4479 family protein [Halalkalibacillus halophilus]
MQVVYNTKGIGDVFIITLKKTEENVETKSYGDVTKVQDKETKDVVAYNIFNASKYLNLQEGLPIQIDSELVKRFEKIFQQNGLEDTLEQVDVSPKFVIGKVSQVEKHPEADKLNICQVDVGEEELQIVCGAKNVSESQKVVVAKVGAFMPDGMAIEASELRGVASSGMICSAKELNLDDPTQQEGIFVLSDDAEVGQPFAFEVSS